MIRGHQIPHPEEVVITEAIFGAPVKVEFWLTRESETSFFDNQFSAELSFDTSEELGKFLLLHPWFCQHVVLVWKESGKTINIVIKSFHVTAQMKNSIRIIGVEVQPVTNLTACEMIEEARQAIESYDGTKVNAMMEKFNERLKHYFQ